MAELRDRGENLKETVARRIAAELCVGRERIVLKKVRDFVVAPLRVVLSAVRF
jgi:hypothetical protein